MIILSFLSLFTVEAIQHALQTKTKVQAEIDRNSTVRDALRVMERDINMAFNYRDVGIQLYNMAQDQRLKAAQAGTGTPSPGMPPPPPVDVTKYKHKVDTIVTQFVGEPDSLAFTSLSNVRMTEDQHISSQAEIAYTLKPCRRRSDQQQSSQCLWRRVANYLHTDVTQEYGQETVLLENVKDFKLRYLGPSQDENPEWIDTWKSVDTGDSRMSGKFPYAVEITIEVSEPNVKGGKEKSLRMTTVAGIRNPNNPIDPNTGMEANGAVNPADGSIMGQPGSGAATPGGFNPTGVPAPGTQ